jgi:hypothetical protein
MARSPKQVLTRATTRAAQTEEWRKAKDRVPEGQGFVASPTPAGGVAPASVQESPNAPGDGAAPRPDGS